jgi:hypothetical protein
MVDQSVQVIYRSSNLSIHRIAVTIGNVGRIGATREGLRGLSPKIYYSCPIFFDYLKLNDNLSMG